VRAVRISFFPHSIDPFRSTGQYTIIMASVARTFSRAVARSNPVRPVARNARFTLPAQAFRTSSRRGYSSEAGAGKSSNSGLIWGGLGLVAAGGAGYYFYQSGDVKAKATGPFVPTKEDYQKVYDEIARLLVEKDDYDDGSYGPVCGFGRPIQVFDC
jgi:cytochrome c peroxidase